MRNYFHGRQHTKRTFHYNVVVVAFGKKPSVKLHRTLPSREPVTRESNMLYPFGHSVFFETVTDGIPWGAVRGNRPLLPGIMLTVQHRYTESTLIIKHDYLHQMMIWYLTIELCGSIVDLRRNLQPLLWPPLLVYQTHSDDT